MRGGSAQIAAGVRPAVLALFAAVVAASCAGGTHPAVRTETRAGVPHFRHVILIVFENHGAAEVLGNSSAPTFNRLGSRYATISHYTAVAHPSLPNYLALVSGSTQGIDSDCAGCLVDGRSLADTLAAAGKTWKTYAKTFREQASPEPRPAGMQRSTTPLSTFFAT
jgi:hypothetical protein